MMRYAKFKFLILVIIFSNGKLIGQEKDLCHYSNYDHDIFQYIFNDDLSSVKNNIDGNKKLILSSYGELSITPLKYSILMNRNSITKCMYDQLRRRRRRNNEFIDNHIKMAVLSGNAFALELILHKSKKKSLEPYNKSLAGLLTRREFAKMLPGEQSLCFKAKSKASILELVEIYFKRANSRERNSLANILIKKCPEYLAKNESRLLSYIEVSENNLEVALIGLINTMEDEYEQGINAYARILLGMLESCSDENAFNVVYTDLLTYCVKSKDRNAYEEFEKLGLFEPLKTKSWN